MKYKIQASSVNRCAVLNRALVKLTLITLSLSAVVLSQPSFASDESKLVYLNQNIGFNVTGYKYEQSQFPCDIDKVLVQRLTEQAKTRGIQLEPVATADKILNGVVPVVAIDVEQLVLGGKERQFGTKQTSPLPKVQITAALVKGKDEIITAKHTCAIMTLNEFTPSTNVLDLGSTGTTVCSATRKCLKDLSKDVVDWVIPQL